MSWDSYIDNLKAQSADSTGKQHLTAGAICGLDGSIWAQKDLPLTAAEITHIVKGLLKAGDLQSAGVSVAGVKHMYLQSDDRQIQAKKKDHGGVSIAKAKTCIVIGKYSEGNQPGPTRKAVEVIRDYLESVNL